MVYPVKLMPGDEVRVIAPSLSLSVVPEEVIRRAEETLNKLGFRVTYGKHVFEQDEFSSTSIESRIEDIQEACSNPSVKCVMTVLGGFNVNQLLSYLDYKDFYTQPKIWCGYSDITALTNAIYAKCGLVTYSSPHFSTLGMKYGLDYVLEYFSRCLTQDGPYGMDPSPFWSDDHWYRNQEQRTFIKNQGPYGIHDGEAYGTLLGGNLCTFNLLQGTQYMPDLHGSLLLLEDDDESRAGNFDRDLQSLIHQPGFEGVKGILIGRFQKASNVDRSAVVKIIESKRELRNIPVAAGLDFGHTTPMFTFPIGGKGSLRIANGSVDFSILEH